MYTDLAKCAVSDIYHYGMVPAAMPEITLHLMAKLWVRSNMTLRTHYAHPDVEEDFGLNPHLDFGTKPQVLMQHQLFRCCKPSKTS